MIVLIIYKIICTLAVFSILILVHEFGHFFVARKLGVRVEKFSLGLGPQIYKRKGKETEYCLSAIPFGGYVKLAGDNFEEFTGKNDEFLSQSPGKRFGIIFAGPLVNYLLGFLVFWFIYFVGFPVPTTKVGGVLDDYGAKQAGIQAGDKITAIDGEKVAYWEQLQNIIQSKKNVSSVNLSVLRGSDTHAMNVALKQKEVEDIFGKKHDINLLGITVADETVTLKFGFAEAFIKGANKTWDLTKLTYNALWFILTGQMSIRESVTGPLGVLEITSRVATMGGIAILNLLALLSISLALFNILPLPVLDGGHIFLLGLEKIRGRALSIKAEQKVNQIGLSIIVLLIVLVTYNDILRMFGDKIQRIFVK